MGWVGWTEEQTLATDMQAIESAYRGAHERLCAMAGREMPHAKIDTAAQKMTPELVASMFSGKNR